jgi:radical SAM-linked protein
MKLRIRFTKLGKVRFTSHRDVARVWERAIRRASLPVAYSEGFSPRPKVAFGLALSTGAESLAEFLDIELAHDVDPEASAAGLADALPAGFTVTAAQAVPAGVGSLQQVVTSCSWQIDLDPEVDLSTARTAVDRMVAAESVIVTRERKGKQVEDDLRPALLALDVIVTDVAATDGSSAADRPRTTLLAELGTQPRALRPAELLAALGFASEDARVLRTHQWIHDGDARRELLPAAPFTAAAREPARDSRRESTDVRPAGERPSHHATAGDPAQRPDHPADAAERPELAADATERPRIHLAL